MFLTLRTYLEYEYKAKHPDKSATHFKKDLWHEIIVDAPKQNNLTDCGLYVLQYVEQFFKDDTKEDKYPMKKLHNWFPVSVIENKRGEIANLLKSLIEEENPGKAACLPDLGLKSPQKPFNWDQD